MHATGPNQMMQPTWVWVPGRCHATVPSQHVTDAVAAQRRVNHMRCGGSTACGQSEESHGAPAHGIHHPQLIHTCTCCSSSSVQLPGGRNEKAYINPPCSYRERGGWAHTVDPQDKALISCDSDAMCQPVDCPCLLSHSARQAPLSWTRVPGRGPVIATLESTSHLTCHVSRRGDSSVEIRSEVVC
jgi:hypothetical protein